MSNINTYVDFENFILETGIEKDQISDLYKIFIDELKSENELVRMYFDNSDYIRLKNVVHNIKGISSSYKAEKLFNLAKDIYSELKAENYIDLEKKINQLEELIEITISSIFSNLFDD